MRPQLRTLGGSSRLDRNIKELCRKQSRSMSRAPKRISITVKSPSIEYQKTSIPKALREQVWIQYAGNCFERRCLVPWCKNKMTVFDFHVGHDKPESQGGATEITNLRPICSRCNLSMGSQYSIQEWSLLSKPVGCWPWLCP